MDFHEKIERAVLTLITVTLLLLDLLLVMFIISPEKYVDKTLVVESQEK